MTRIQKSLGSSSPWRYIQSEALQGATMHLRLSPYTLRKYGARGVDLANLAFQASG
jgi:hypothetical protein